MKKIVLLIIAMIVSVSISTYANADSRSQPIVAEYFGIWTGKNQTWEQKFRPDTPFDKLNRLYISFGRIIKKADGHFSIEFDGMTERAQAIIDRMKINNPQAELFLAVGGDGSASSYGGAAKDPKFAENVRDFLLRYGFHGFDVDWEMGLNKNDLNLVITNLYATLHNSGLKLTLDVWPFVSSAYDMNILKNNLDQINIMSYGTGLNLTKCTELYKNAGFPVNKIIGGIETESDYNQFGGKTDTLGANGTIAAKAHYAMQNGLAGMMGWRLDNDYATKQNPHAPTYKGAIELWTYMNS